MSGGAAFELSKILSRLFKEVSIYIVVFFPVVIPIIFNRLLRDKFKWQKNIWLSYFIPSLVIFSILWFVFAPYSLGDFDQAYYIGGRLVFENPNSLYYWDSYVNKSVNVIGFVNLPILAFIFSPLAFFPLPLAQFLFLILGIFSSILTYVKLRSLLFINSQQIRDLSNRQWILIAVIIFSSSLFYSLGSGNTTHFLLLILVFAWRALNKKLDILAGILLAIIALIKPPLALLGLFFIIKFRWRVVLGFMITCIVTCMASLLIFGIDLHLEWYRICIAPFSGKPLAAYNVQSIDGFLSRLLLGADPLSWQPLEVDWQYKLIRFTVIASLIGSTILVCRYSKSKESDVVENIDFAIMVTVTLLVSPISWTHYYVLLILPFTLFIGDFLGNINRNKSLYFLTGLSILLMTPQAIWILPSEFSNIAHPILKFIVYRILLSSYFFGGLIFLCVLFILHKSALKNDLDITDHTLL